MFRIIGKTLKNQIRKPKWILFLLIFPIFLVYFISYILSSTFDSKINLDPVDVCWLDESSGTASSCVDVITSASRNITDTYGIKLEDVKDVETGKEQARVNKKVFVHLDGEQIKVYYNENDSLNGSRAIALFQGIVDSVDVVNQIYSINSNLADKILSENNSAYDLPVKTLDSKNYMDSYDYFGIAEITLMIMYIALISLGDIFNDRQKMVRARFKMAGLSNLQYYLGEFIAYFLIAIVVFIPAFLVSKYAVGANWGNNNLLSYGYLMLFAAFNILLGMLLAVVLKERGKIDLILAVIILPVFSFLGGSYTNFPINVDSALEKVTLISPLRWVNLGLFQHIYSNNNTMLIVSSIIFLVSSIVMFMLILWKSKRDEVKV